MKFNQLLPLLVQARLLGQSLRDVLQGCDDHFELVEAVLECKVASDLELVANASRAVA